MLNSVETSDHELHFDRRHFYSGPSRERNLSSMTVMQCVGLQIFWPRPDPEVHHRDNVPAQRQRTDADVQGLAARPQLNKKGSIDDLW